MTFNWKTTPYKEHVVYRAYTVDGVLLYIGATCDLPQRLAVHANESPWWFACAEVTVEDFVNRDDALAAERAVIYAEQPLFNMRHTGRPPRVSAIPIRQHVPQRRGRHEAVA